MEKWFYFAEKCSKRRCQNEEIIPTEKSLTIQKEVVENIRSVETKLREEYLLRIIRPVLAF